MSEPVRVHAFDAHARRTAAGDLVAPGITLAARRPRSMLDVRGNAADAVFTGGLREHFGVQLPAAPNTATGNNEIRALWLGPDEWLLVSASAALHPRVSGAATFVDVSHGRAVVRVCGRAVRDVLAKGCGLDLHPRAFPADRCAQTAIGRVSVILDHAQPDVFDVYCSRSYAGSLWHWLVEACAEYGCKVAPPPNGPLTHSGP